MRTWGLLKQIGAHHDVHLVVVTRRPLSDEQRAQVQPYVRSLAEAPMRDGDWTSRGTVVGKMVSHRIPYHPAVLRHSLAPYSDLVTLIRTWPGIVFTNTGHWGTFVAEGSSAANWILNQCDADIQFWQAYAAQAGSSLARTAARLNYKLARHHFPAIYQRVGCIVAVSEDDRALTIPYAGSTPVDVILNGIDAATYHPDRDRRAHGDGAQLLFTGTSARRNMTALRDFLDHIVPRISETHPEARLLVAGNFTTEAQESFRQYEGLEFTGRVDEMTPYFDSADIFVAPFRDAHGSKLKVAEAMAMALPVVATEAGVRGFPLVHGESVLIAHSDEEFAQHVIYLIEHPKERSRLGYAGRAIALETLNWDTLGGHARELIEARWKLLSPGAQVAAIELSNSLFKADCNRPQDAAQTHDVYNESKTA